MKKRNVADVKNFVSIVATQPTRFTIAPQSLPRTLGSMQIKRALRLPLLSHLTLSSLLLPLLLTPAPTRESRMPRIPCDKDSRAAGRRLDCYVARFV